MTKVLADELKVTGGVWNEMDGSVTIEAIGDYPTLAKFIEKVKASPSPFGKVTHTTINKDCTIKDSQNFSIRN
ncbi:acylphosphatase [Enterococcus columbae DSM 7374 = ATCC 51263]|nr:acylphosphatase [Enterococcus columbae DSM 7374 = ATCC 51263]